MSLYFGPRAQRCRAATIFHSNRQASSRLAVLAKGLIMIDLLVNGVGALNNNGDVKLAESAGRRSKAAFDFDRSFILWLSIFNK